MRVVIDTNVFVSGVFFTGPPYRILEAWRISQVTLVVSPDILEEYFRVGEELAAQFPGVDLQPALDLVAVAAVVVDAPGLPEQICRDPDDDKFLACALSGRCKIVVTGDKALLEVSRYADIAVISPRQFLDRYLKKSS